MNQARAIFDLEILPLFQASQPRWLERARITARYLARLHGKTNINEVRKECPPPHGIDGRIMGAVFNRKDFIRVGFVNSERRECHGRCVAEFSLRDQTGGLA